MRINPRLMCSDMQVVVYASKNVCLRPDTSLVRVEEGLDNRVDDSDKRFRYSGHCLGGAQLTCYHKLTKIIVSLFNGLYNGLKLLIGY